jgi:cyclic dehypoxanthinyl futalosine synthase
MKVKDTLEVVTDRGRLTPDDALTLLEEGDLIDLGRAADTVRREKHPDGVATFIIDRNINYTNICRNRCRFCAFYREPDDPKAYVLDQSTIERKIAEMIDLGGTQVMLQGGINPDLHLDYYTNMFSSIKARFDVRIHSLSPPEIAYIAESEGIAVREALSALKAAGLDSLPGGGAEILVDSVRGKVSPHKVSSETWLHVMEEAHAIGLKGTATMMLGTVETMTDRVQHLAKIRDLQDRTGGFMSFIPWTYQPGNTELGGRSMSSLAYIKMLAVSRLFLDNIDNIQGSWVTQGKDIGQLCLSFGANDLGSVMIEENVVRATGVSYKMSVDEMVRMIKSAGRIPVQRDTEFNLVKTHC